jgi:outer membrane protein
MWRGRLVLGAAVLFILMGQAYAQRGVKIAVVDLQAVLDGSVRGKSAKENLSKLGLELQEQIKSKRAFKEQREAELQQLRTEMRTQSPLLNEKARVDKQEDFRKKARELKRFIDDTNNFIEDAMQEFREKEAVETRRLLVEVRKIVQEVGKQEGYTLVLEGNESAALVLYAEKSIDITSKVIQRYDQSSAAKR